MKHLSITFLALACACAPAWAQQTAQVVPPGQAVYQSNTPVLAQPATPPVAPPANASQQAGQPPAVAPISSGPGTASDQGYMGDMFSAPSAWDMETLRRRESPRQRGEQLQVASRKNGVGTQIQDNVWFSAWERRLVSIGVHPDKVKFEGRRLTKEQFAMWASRQVWAVEADLIAP